MPKAAVDSLARQRILDTASGLFYRQGYLATGINQVIAEAKVSKNTFYYYFPSKEDLCLAYLRARHGFWMASLARHVAACPTPYARLLSVFTFLHSWLTACDFRGCAFLNIASEIPAPGHRLRQETLAHKNALRAYLEQLLQDLKHNDPRFGTIDPHFLGEALYVLTEGTISACQLHADASLANAAGEAFARLLGK